MLPLNAPPETIVNSTREQFAIDPSLHIPIVAIGAGGSDRHYHRLLLPNGKSIVHCHHHGQQAENQHFTLIARELAKHGIHVPAILAESDDTMETWLEDIGDTSLFSLGQSHSPDLQNAYSAAIKAIAHLHSLPAQPPPKALINHLQTPFTAKLYRWEQNYFLNQFATRHTNASTADIEYARNHPALISLADKLAAIPRCLIHRDFQSQNIHWHHNKAYLIDFQGLRIGLAEYDLASLLYDPYAPWINDPMRNSLLNTYRQYNNQTNAANPLTLNNCAIQRLMQALGAYARLAAECNKPYFVNYLPPALNHLQSLLTNHPANEALTPFLTLRDL